MDDLLVVVVPLRGLTFGVLWHDRRAFHRLESTLSSVWRALVAVATELEVQRAMNVKRRPVICHLECYYGTPSSRFRHCMFSRDIEDDSFTSGSQRRSTAPSIARFL